MIQIPKLTDDDVAVRTQITLTANIKQIVEEAASQRGESLSEYLRKASMIRYWLEKNEKEDLKKLASQVIGSVDIGEHPHWGTRKKVVSWSRKIREEF